MASGGARDIRPSVRSSIVSVFFADAVRPAASKTVANTVIVLASSFTDFETIPASSAHSMLHRTTLHTHANDTSFPSTIHIPLEVNQNPLPCLRCRGSVLERSKNIVTTKAATRERRHDRPSEWRTIERATRRANHEANGRPTRANDWRSSERAADVTLYPRRDPGPKRPREPSPYLRKLTHNNKSTDRLKEPDETVPSGTLAACRRSCPLDRATFRPRRDSGDSPHRAACLYSTALTVHLLC